jgi:predicted molibdopterin-dependent oxidoreductase YjgC
MAHRLTTCTFCGVGCGLYVETAGNHILGVYPSVSHPTNQGKICVRGWHVHEVASSPDRITRPLLRTGRSFQEVSWEEAFGYIADRLREIRDRHGANSLAFLNSPRCSNEEAYLLQKFARCVIGTNNVHHGTGVYCNNSINALIDMVGIPASTNSLQELADSEVILVDGVDLGRRMPTLAGVVLRAKLKGARLIVLGTRRHRLAESADLFLQMKPGTEALVYGAMQKVIVDRGLADLHFIKARCSNYDAFVSEISHYDLLQAAEGSGVAPELIESAAILYAKAARAAVLYSTSMEDRSREAVQAAVNLVLLSGQLGKKGSGLFPLCEQNNLQGVCDMGMLPDRLPGYIPVADAARRGTFEEIWRTKLPEDPGHGARSILWQRGNGILKALWLARYDPVQTAFLPEITDYLRQFELLVVQHVFMTPTAELAHVVLPTTAFGEEQVSFTSTDRRIQLAEQVVEPPGGLLPAWAQIVRVAQLMGAAWNYATAADVMDEIGTVVPLYSGANYENLGRDYGRQWPCTSDRPLGTQFLFAENGTSRKFHFAAVPKPALADHTSKEFPFMLVFGSSLYYWSQNVLVRHSETLKREYRWLFLDYPDGFVELNTADAAAIGVRDGQPIRLMAERNFATCAARVTDEVMKGTIFVPYFMSDVERQMLGGTGNGACLLPVRIEKEAA